MVGSCPSRRDVNNSVSGVKFATALVPLPVATECIFVPSAGLVTSNIQGSAPPLIATLYAPDAVVVAEPVPVWHFALTLALGIARPVAATPVNESVDGWFPPPPPPPQADKSATELMTSASFIFLYIASLLFQFLLVKCTALNLIINKVEAIFSSQPVRSHSRRQFRIVFFNHCRRVAHLLAQRMNVRAVVQQLKRGVGVAQ